MPFRIIICLLAALITGPLRAQQFTAPTYYQEAFDELSAMLEGTQRPDFERAVFVTENAYYENAVSYEAFQDAIGIQVAIIKEFVAANQDQDWTPYQSRSRAVSLGTNATQTRQANFQKALGNWAIYSYMTDTLQFQMDSLVLPHLPFTYSHEDPFGTLDWRNSQTLHLMESGQGNCYALATLFKIFSERLGTDARIATTPQHVYIQHEDPSGYVYNVELASRSFPADAAIQTLTYTTGEAIRNNIAMRSLDLRQSIGMCLVYLAKSYEYKYQTQNDDFLLACAEMALAYDAHNLNALLLKAQVYEQRVMQEQMPAAAYEELLANLYTLGYRQMPDDMQDIILANIQNGTLPHKPVNKTPNAFESVGGQSRYVTLSGGLFEEVHESQKLARYGRSVFDAEAGKVVRFLDEDSTAYQVDPVVFALSVDPLTSSYPWYTPYQFAGNRPIESVDLDGLEELSAKELQPDFYNVGTIIEQKGSAYLYKGDGQWVQGYSGPVSEGIGFSTVNLWEGVPENLEGYQGYTYSMADLNMRHYIMNGGSHYLQQSVLSFESKGWAEPLTDEGFRNTYGDYQAGLMIFCAYVEMGLSMAEAGGMGNHANAGGRKPMVINMTKASKKSSFADNVISDPRSLWGKSADEIAAEFNNAGYKTTIKQSTRGSKKSIQLSIEGHRDIDKIQVHPGGGIHGGAYYKISSGPKGTIKIVDPATYKALPGEKGTIINVN